MICGNTYLGTSNNTLLLNPLNRLKHTDTAKHGIWRKTLPVSASLWSSANWPCNRAELDSHAFSLVLGSHSCTACVHKAAIEGGGDSAAGWKRRDVVCVPDSCGTVLETETVHEAEAGDGAGGSDAGFALPSSYLLVNTVS